MFPLIHTRFSKDSTTAVTLLMFSLLSNPAIAGNDADTVVDTQKTVHHNHQAVATDAVPDKHQAESSSDSPLDLATLTMTVYKSPTCGCCSGWVDYMKEEGFTLESINTDQLDSIKTNLGLVKPELHSCHTATIDGYVIEGHVPASDVKKLLSERPSILGLTAPGMPMMSPGMASRTPEGYDVLAVTKSGRTRIWSSY